MSSQSVSTPEAPIDSLVPNRIDYLPLQNRTMAPKSLPTRQLGKDGPQVTACGLGLMGLSIFYGQKPPDEERFKFLDHALESGCTFWDSSDVYVRHIHRDN
jgi:hypothetical protein